MRDAKLIVLLASPNNIVISNFRLTPWSIEDQRSSIDISSSKWWWQHQSQPKFHVDRHLVQSNDVQGTIGCQIRIIILFHWLLNFVKVFRKDECLYLGCLGQSTHLNVLTGCPITRYLSLSIRTSRHSSEVPILFTCHCPTWPMTSMQILFSESHSFWLSLWAQMPLLCSYSTWFITLLI